MDYDGIQNTPGAELVPLIASLPVDVNVKKGQEMHVDSLSAIRNAHGKATPLLGYLRKHNVTDITIIGVATEYCMKETVLDALAEGRFKVSMDEKGIEGVNKKAAKATMKQLQSLAHSCSYLP